MSGILGIYNRDAAPISKELINSVIKPMKYWGSDGTQTWCSGPIGLCHFMHRTAPESATDVQPLKSACGSYVLISHSRLDNRDELIDWLNIPKANAPGIPDSRLILKSYLKWGKKCVDYLIGDWVFAIWDNNQQYLFVARDHHGLTGLFYYQSQNIFAFATSVKGIFPIQKIPMQLNEAYLARYLTCFHDHSDTTIFKNIYRLPPAHFMIITPRKIFIKQYWYPEQIKSIRFKNKVEYVDAFLDVFTKAIKSRLRTIGEVGVSLSGGLDSSSVAAIATRELSHLNKILYSFSSVPNFKPDAGCPAKRFLDETPYILELEKLYPNLQINLLNGDDISPMQGVLRVLDILDEPVHGVVNLYWVQAIHKQARNLGVSTLLTGQHGNSTISWHGVTQQTNAGADFRAILKHKFLMPLISDKLLRAYHIHKGRAEPIISQNSINRDFANRVKLNKLLIEYGHFNFPTKRQNTKEQRLLSIRPGRSKIGANNYLFSASANMMIADPTIDKRVLEYCISIPDEEYFLNGQNRFLIRRAMKNILPDKVRLNTRRGLQASDLVARLYNTRKEVKEYLNQISASEFVRSYLDIPKMWSVYHLLEKGENVRRDNMVNSILLRGLMAGLFLLRFDK